MAEATPMEPHADDGDDRSRRDFLYTTTSVLGAIGVAGFAWPIIDQMNPAADTLALASIEVDATALQPGQALTVKWRGKPVFIRYRTEEEIQAAQAVDLGALTDPQADGDRVKDARFLVVLGVCTHLGCVPLGQKPTDSRGDFAGYYCPCHGSHYDTSGRIRKGPAPKNLEVPEYAFVSEGRLKIG